LKSADASIVRDDFAAFCHRLVIELGMPRASTLIDEPGELECALLNELQMNIGIGRYPNEDKDLDSVAARIVRRATLARANGETLVPADVERAISLRTDFGRVSQAYPLDRATFVDRSPLREALRNSALNCEHQIVLGSPGSGKSWELTALANDLRDAGAVVARHYCYFQPGDELSERRVTGDVFVGNLIAEIVDALPSVRSSGIVNFAAGLTDLEAALESAVHHGRPVVIMVDGLDHIARVRAEASALSEAQTDVIERLATLNLPHGVVLLIGSQSGDHLHPLLARWSDATVREIPPWEAPDVIALARLHGVLRALATAGIADDSSVLASLAERAEGNPLYTRYLSVGLVNALGAGEIADPIAWLAQAPVIHGEIEAYYSHLYELSAAKAQAIADIFGLLDFGVTEAELSEIVPPGFRGWIAPALTSISPLLTQAAGQGGMRVFHESFRRFIRKQLQRRGRSIADAIAPIASWLSSRGFLEDAKAYRFLLPCLARGERSNEVWDLVGSSFVSDSLAWAHPHEATLLNIAFVATLAAKAHNWAVLARCAELRRAAMSVLDEARFASETYWQAYAELFGVETTSARLLFEGRPVLGGSDGLRACAVIDNAGGVPPWAKYLEHFGRSISFTLAFDGPMNDSERLAVAFCQGLLRTNDIKNFIKILHSFFRSAPVRPRLVREIGKMLCKAYGRAGLERFAHILRRKNLQLPNNVTAALLLAVADAYHELEETAECASAAAQALLDTDQLEIAVDCVTYGAVTDLFVPVLPAPEAFDIGLGHMLYEETAPELRRWIALVRLLAHIPSCAPVLDGEVHRVAGAGWYRCWLRFVVEIAKVEAAHPDKMGIVDAFKVLTLQMEPLKGDPRACDLYYGRYAISEAIAWGLRFVNSESDWEDVLDTLTQVSHDTTTSLQGSETGPLPTDTLLEILLPLARDPIASKCVKARIEAEYERRRKSIGAFYTIHGDHAVVVARARAAAGDAEGAREAWRDASTCFAAYGMHKDATIFELIDGARALKTVSSSESLAALTLNEPLVNAVLAHTDSKSTRHAPNALLRAVLDVDFALGTAVVAATNVNELDTGGWPVAVAVRNVAEKAVSVDPVLVNALLRTLPFEVDADNVGALRAEERFDPILRMQDPALAAAAANEVIAEIASTARESRRFPALMRALEICVENGLEVPQIGEVVPITDSPNGSGGKVDRLRGAIHLGEPAFSQNPSVAEILRGLRRLGELAPYGGDVMASWGGAITTLGYLLDQLIELGDAAAVLRVLYFIARDVRIDFWSKPHPLQLLASSLDEAGQRKEAAVAYVLAYTCVRDDWGGEFGGPKHAHLMERALEIDRDVALDVLSGQVAHNLQQARHGFGLTGEIVERLAAAAENDAAKSAWKEAYRVVEHRLPYAPEGGWFVSTSTVTKLGWSPNESVVALLLARLSDPRIEFKLGALRGFLEAVRTVPSQIARPLRWWFEQQPSDASRLMVLRTWWHGEGAEPTITGALLDMLFALATDPAWGVRRCARALLERVGAAVPVAAPTSLLQSTVSLDTHRQSLAESYARRLGTLTQSMPDLPARIAASIDIPPPKDRSALTPFFERYELSCGRDGKRVPPTAVLSLEAERYVGALHRAMPEVELSTADYRRIVKEAFPDVGAHLGAAATRTPRPSWPRPSALFSGRFDVSVDESTDARYDRWVRLALHEDEYLRARWHDPPTERVTTSASICPDSVPDGALPFLQGDPDWLWSRGPADVAAWEDFLPGGAYFVVVEDWLDNRFLLLPPRRMLEIADLRPPQYGAPLWWIDERGAPAIVIRTWQVASAESLYREDVEVFGSDLMVRPDVFELFRASSSMLADEIRITRRQL
jgi:hypothetical protein